MSGNPTGFFEEFQYHLVFFDKIPTGKVENKEEKRQQKGSKVKLAEADGIWFLILNESVLFIQLKKSKNKTTLNPNLHCQL